MNEAQFKAMFAFGSSGEQIVGDWLASKGVVRFPLHPLSLLKHGGPRVVMANGVTLPCPDFACWGVPPHPDSRAEDADQYFVEVKRFKKWWSEAGDLQTGIEEDRVREYKHLATDTGKKVFVYFLHLDEVMSGDGLYFTDISKISSVGETTPPDGRKLLMFSKKDLVRLAEEIELSWFDPTVVVAE
jgi:hypothetical protein